MTLTNSYLTTCAYALALRRASLTSALALLFKLGYERGIRFGREWGAGIIFHKHREMGFYLVA